MTEAVKHLLTAQQYAAEKAKGDKAEITIRLSDESMGGGVKKKRENNEAGNSHNNNDDDGGDGGSSLFPNPHEGDDDASASLKLLRKFVAEKKA